MACKQYDSFVAPRSVIPIILVVLALIHDSCDESLPPRDNPFVVFQGKMEMEYVLSVSSNALHVYLKVRNIYDETLQGVAVLTGNVEIVWALSPSIKKTATMDRQNLIHATQYDPATGMLTVDPGDSIIFLYAWDIMAAGDSLLRAQIFTYRTDPTCPFRKISYEETFNIRSQLFVYDNRSPVNFDEIAYTFCHVDTFVATRDCPIPQSRPPCGPN